MRGRLILVLLLAAAISGARVGDAVEQSKFDKSGQATVRIVLPEGTAVTFTAVVGAPCSSLRPSPHMFWGADVGMPRRVVVGVTLAAESDRIDVPFSVFSDLSEPRSIGVEVQGRNGFAIIVQGGDASTSYKAVAYFDYSSSLKQFIPKRRRVSLNEFEAEVWEETTYSWNTSQN